MLLNLFPFISGIEKIALERRQLANMSISFFVAVLNSILQAYTLFECVDLSISESPTALNMSVVGEYR